MENEISKNLTNKQKLFVEYYLLDWNATQAAIKAGYSKKTAKEIGCENLTKPNISNHISEILKDIEKVVGISRIGILLELKKIAFGNIGDFFDNWTKYKDFNKLTPEQKTCIAEISSQTKKVPSVLNEGEFDEVETVKIKMHDKIKAIEIINKMLGFNEPNKIDLTGSKVKVTYTNKA